MATITSVSRAEPAHARTRALARVQPRTWAGALVVVVAPLYAATLLRGPGYSGDSTKFQYLGWVLGTGHPPGEPTYTMLNAAFQRLVPLGNIALTANLLSLVLGLAAILLLFHLLRTLGHRDVVAFAVAGAFGLMPAFWSQSSVAEVYTLLSLFILGTIHLLVRWRQTGDRRYLIGMLAVYGLSVGVHTSVGLLAPGIVYLVWRTDRSVFRDPRVVGAAVLFALLGLAQYGYLFWRSLDPSTPYVEANVTDLGSFVEVITARQFQSWMFAFTPQQVLTERLPAVGRLLARELLVLLPVAAVGIWRMRRDPLNVALGLWTGLLVLFMLNYNVPDLPVFFLPAYLLITIWIAAGTTSILDSWRWRPQVALAGLVLLPLLFAATNLTHVRTDGDRHAGGFARTILANVPDGSVIMPGDYHFAQYLWFYTIGHEVGPIRDIHVVSYKTGVGEFGHYLQGGDLEIAEQRTTVPHGRPTFVLRAEDAEWFSDEAGFTVTPVETPAHILYRVEAPATASDAGADA